MKKYDICIVGGLGHVGLPLGIVFADKGLNVVLNDINAEAAKKVESGELPFVEYGAEPLLKKAIKNGTLSVSLGQKTISEARYVIIALGTPVDEYLNPKARQFLEFFEHIKHFLSPNQTIIIRSTVYPNTCEQILNCIGKDHHIAYCPERIVQGYSVEELTKLPQIVSGLSDRAICDASALFSKLSPQIIEVEMGEAELIKLFSNAWRYVQFAMANQFYMISNNFGVNYDRVREAMKEGYERANSLPGAGFAAGPCLLKDTMQLAAFNSNNFMLGHAAMMVNEGLPNYLIDDLKKRYDLTKIKVGILGMAFKADIDDIRDSLSFKLGKILRFNGCHVYYSDEFAKNPDFVSKEKLIKESDVVIVAVPHSNYKGLNISEDKEVVDLWSIITGGKRKISNV